MIFKYAFEDEKKFKKYVFFQARNSTLFYLNFNLGQNIDKLFTVQSINRSHFAGLKRDRERSRRKNYTTSQPLMQQQQLSTTNR